MCAGGNNLQTATDPLVEHNQQMSLVDKGDSEQLAVHLYGEGTQCRSHKHHSEQKIIQTVSTPTIASTRTI